MLNFAAVPVLNITLRNNLLEVLPIKRYLRRKRCCLFLLDDEKNSVKGLWSIILSLPVAVVVLLTRDVQVMVTYTGGFMGACILLVIPATLVFYARKRRPEEKFGVQNPYKSPFGSGWLWFVLAWALATWIAVIVKIATGDGGHG